MPKHLATYLAAAALLAALPVTQAVETHRPAAIPAQTAAPDLRGLKLGMTPGEILATFPRARCNNETSGKHAGCLVRPVNFDGTENAALAVHLANGRAIRIDAILLSPETFAHMTALIAAKLGPSVEDPRVPADGNHKVWSGHSWFLVANRFDDEMFSSVSLVDPAHVGDESHYEAAEAAKAL